MADLGQDLTQRLHTIAERFAVDGRVVEIVPFGSGHINDTFACTFCIGRGVRRRWVLQRINHRVFRDPYGLMDNVTRVTEHIRAKIIAKGGDPERETLSFVPVRNGAWVHHDEQDGTFWRMCGLVEDAQSFERALCPEQLSEAGRIFGRFQAFLADLPGPRLQETIPHFHDTPERLRTFQRVVEFDPCNRAAKVQAEIREILRRESLVFCLAKQSACGVLPERITHNDTKLNNVLFDRRSGKALCVVDLDTVMPGLVLHDFGDLVRTGATMAAEDETDTSRVAIDMRAFEQIIRGYLGVMGAVLTSAEIQYLAVAPLVITLEQAMRFLTDYLEGDTYYKVKHPEHNLQRSRAQLALLASMETCRERMEKAVDSAYRYFCIT